MRPVTRPRPTLTIGLNPFGARPGGGWRVLLDQARAVEEAGADRVVVPDHVVLGPRVGDYPWGTFPTGPEADWLEPLTVLTAMAAVTERVRLTTGVLVAPLRPAAVLAKTVATLDVLSDGRVDLGVGTGWQPEELAAAGVPFAERGAALTETVAACRALWSGEPTTFDGVHVHLDGVWCAPRPAQERLPVWFSGTLHARNLRRITELGDGWIPIMGTTPDALRPDVDRLRTAVAAAGRDPDGLTIRLPAGVVRRADGAIDEDATTDRFGDLLAAGATDLNVNSRTAVSDPRDLATLRREVAVLRRCLSDAAARRDRTDR